MAVAIRLNRKGTKDRPYYKIVAVDSRKRRDGEKVTDAETLDSLNRCLSRLIGCPEGAS
jgi:small subunit ribosomal protein S16